jgi:hypothetical protein
MPCKIHVNKVVFFKGQTSQPLKTKITYYHPVSSTDSAMRCKCSKQLGHFRYLVVKFDKWANYLGLWFLVQELKATINLKSCHHSLRVDGGGMSSSRPALIHLELLSAACMVWVHILFYLSLVVMPQMCFRIAQIYLKIYLNIF